MDISKWKSMAIRKEDHTLLKGLCADKYRAPAAMFQKILHDYIGFQAKKKGVSVAGALQISQMRSLYW